MRKRVNKIISVALSATLAFGVFTALPMSANEVVSTASEVSAEAIPKHELYKSYTYARYCQGTKLNTQDTLKSISKEIGFFYFDLKSELSRQRLKFKSKDGN